MDKRLRRSTDSSSASTMSVPSNIYQPRIFVIGFIFLSLYMYSMNIDQNSRTRTNQSDQLNSIFLPYIYKFSSDHAPMVKATINGVDFELPMDTGSTGLLISKFLLPMVQEDEGTPAYEYLSSSKILYTGRLVELPVTFYGFGASNATATIPVLVVDQSVVCPWYDAKTDGPNCPLLPDQPPPKPRDKNTTYMGIGFGRNKHGDGQPYALPSANPFLNIHTVNSNPVVPSLWRTGYVISTEGVHLGLTEGNTRGFVFADLEPGTTHEEDARDWAMVNMSFSINDQERSSGPALLDTGIAQMYLRADEGVEIPTVTIRNPNANGTDKLVQRVKPGTKFAIGIPSLDDGAVAMYSFTLGAGSDMEPTQAIPSRQGSGAYINTGRHFFYGFAVAFDAVAGRLGFRPVASPSL